MPPSAKTATISMDAVFLSLPGISEKEKTSLRDDMVHPLPDAEKYLTSLSPDSAIRRRASELLSECKIQILRQTKPPHA